MQGDRIALLDVADHHDERSFDIVTDLLRSVDADRDIVRVAREIGDRCAVTVSDIVDVIGVIRL